MKKTHLGKILLEQGVLKEEELAQASALQQEKGKPLEEILLQQGYLSEEAFLTALSNYLDIPYVKRIEPENLDPGLIRRVPIGYYRQHHLFPIRLEDQVLKVATANPFDLQPLDDLSVILGYPVEPVLCPDREIMNAINAFYDREVDSAEQVIQDLDAEDLGILAGEIEETQDLLDLATEAPIIKLVNTILFQAVRERASDIHIEPFERELKVRYRIDGILYNILTPPKRLQSAIISRIKIMANLNIAEKRLPQDGRIKIRVADKDVDIRVSVIPTAFGERIVLRLLDKSSILLDLEDIGMGKEELYRYSQLIRRSNGIILVTGPTGSGKTTTLYATLNRINSPEKNIITVEDPIEYQLHGIGQMQVNPKIQLTFASGLRSILRQDPDIIMVGEIRDLETAEIAIQASLTGHLVFSTLHTNDAAGAITRLLDMGVEPYLVASAVIGILAQRLVRVICPQCKERYIPEPKSLEEVGLHLFQEGFDGYLYRGKGCEACMHTGFRGRTGIYELLVMDDPIRRLTLHNTDSNTIKREAIQRGMKTLLMDGVEKMKRGITTLEEVLRVTQE
ncbi:MAG: type II secretion system protein GspE [Nitrospinota bacterium]|nr:MAG: type II secretion system protein GspE [Nitrospinota bacterium]